MRFVRWAVVLGCVVAALAPGPGAATAPGVARRPAASEARVPVLAYYYIWFDRGSWDRAKRDRPELGPYSSDDASVMRQQVRWAKRAGIGGFLVSWKHTPTLDRRLAQLVDIAEQEQFGLGIVYQGLDFNRNPLPVARVGADLGYLASTFAGRAPFKIFAKPLVVWSGTWKFSPEEVAAVTPGLRSALAILASERSVAGYERLAGSVDGDAYYWSSVNPSTYPRYLEKLTDLGRSVHAGGGLWIAPAAPGFDARLIGGKGEVQRTGGDTFLQQIDTALASSPDALGIISWNEFTENSHIEPSVRYGNTALNLVGERLGAGRVLQPYGGTGQPVTAGTARSGSGASPSGATDGLDSSAGSGGSARYGLLVLGGFGACFAVLLIITLRRARRAQPLRLVMLDAASSAEPIARPRSPVPAGVGATATVTAERATRVRAVPRGSHREPMPTTRLPRRRARRARWRAGLIGRVTARFSGRRRVRGRRGRPRGA